MSLHPHVAGLIVTLDPRWRRKIFIGGLVLLLPVVGWPAVLGYRAHFVRHMFGNTPEPLPSWKGAFWKHLRSGWQAMGVIFGHLAPLYGLLAVVLWQRGWRPDETWLWSTLFFVVFPFFSTLSFPMACLALTFSERPWLSLAEAAALFAAFTLTIFLVPAGFMEVSRTGRYRSAFAAWRSWPFAWKHRRLYGSAWWHSCLQGALGTLAVPFTPWGVVWSYLSILALFNEVLIEASVAPGSGWLQRALADTRFVRPTRRGRFAFEDGAGERTTALNLGAFSVPLPRLWHR